MITSLVRRTTPVTAQDLASFVGLGDADNPAFALLADDIIAALERCTGRAIGTVEATVEVWPPWPGSIWLPYSPVTQITRIELVDPWSMASTTLYEDGVDPPGQYGLRAQLTRIPAVLVLDQLDPSKMLRVAYRGGSDQVPTEMLGELRRAATQAWETRSWRPQFARPPITAEEYLAVWR